MSSSRSGLLTPKPAELLRFSACVALAFLCGCRAANDSAAEPTSVEPRSLGLMPEAEILPSGASLTPLGYDAEINGLVSALDLDADGRDEVVIASAREVAMIRVTEEGHATVVWSGSARGGATAIASGDVDGDGRDDLLVGWGMHRDHLDAPAQLVTYRTAGGPDDALLEELVAAPGTSRAQFSSIQVTPLWAHGTPGVLYAHFASKYEVRGAFAELAVRAAEGWKERELHRIRMGAEWLAAPGAPGEAPALIVGRPYGDEVKSHGDVFAIRADGSRTPLTSLRGVRSLASVSVGPKASPVRLVCYGDGWHWRYKADGRGLVTCARRTADGSWRVQRVSETDGYSISAIAAADLDGDGATELVALGPEGVYRFVPTVTGDQSLSWDGGKLGPGASGFAVLDVDGDGRDELVLAGEKPALLRAPR